jgi:TolB protein
LQHEIWVMNADGGNAAQVTPLANGRDVEPDWSPDGTRIVWSTERYGDWEVAVINADGSGLTRLTTQAGDDYTPVWSPDGTNIVFSTGRFDSNQELALMRPDGSNVRRLTNHPDHEQYPAWSPDGAKIAFNCWRRRRGEIASEVCSVNGDGTGELRLTPNFSWASHPAWHR